MGHLGESKQITTVNDEEVVLTSATGQPFRMKVANLGKIIKDIRKFKMPTIDTYAVKLCSIQSPSGFYNASVSVHIDAFQLSCFGVIGINVSGTSVDTFAKLTGFSVSKITNVLFVKTEQKIDVYMTGNYRSNYGVYESDIRSSCELVSLDGIGIIVPVASLNVMKSINIANAMS